MKKEVKVLIWGFGAMGSGMARMLIKKKGVKITGVCDRNPKRVGKSVSEVLEIESDYLNEIIIENNIEKVIKTSNADIALLATDSFTKTAFPKIKLLMEHKINVISTAEEMAYPMAKEPELAKELDNIAREEGVSVLGTGINPGLIMDLLVIVLTGAMVEVDSVMAKRVNSLSPFGKAVMEEQGVGISVDEFNREKENGTLAGHVGFAESINMICDGIGWKLDKPITQSMEAIVSNVERRTKYVEVKPGEVAGCLMEGVGKVNGIDKVHMIHPQQVEPGDEGKSTGDFIELKGSPEINMNISPEVDGGLGTIAMCVNMIPQVINSNPGLKTMLDLPVPRAIMGDMRDLINK